jgi:hypothetical protein
LTIDTTIDKALDAASGRDSALVTGTRPEPRIVSNASRLMPRNVNRP